MNKPRFGRGGIERAAILIARDSGGINRLRSEEDVLFECCVWLVKQLERSDEVESGLLAIDEWLADLSDEQIETVCCGEEREQQAVLMSAPPFTDELLQRYFLEVC